MTVDAAAPDPSGSGGAETDPNIGDEGGCAPWVEAVERGLIDVARSLADEVHRMQRFAAPRTARAAAAPSLIALPPEQESDTRVRLDWAAAAAREQVDRLRTFALTDQLTGLANRAALLDRLAGVCAAGMGASQRTCELVIADLDDFKNVNDAFGHAFGDDVLRILAERLSDLGAITASRIGGDQFAVLGRRPPVGSLAEKVLDACGEPIPTERGEIRLRASGGVTEIRPGDDVMDVMRRADLAMYRAKESSHTPWQAYTDELHAELVHRVRLEADLYSALHGSEFELEYQPIVALGDRSIQGAEALIRWHHRELGTIPPDEFIPMAERTGLIVTIGEWVLRQACRDTLRALDLGIDAHVSVNVSPRQVAEADFARLMQRAMAEEGLSPHRVTLELTEGLLLELADDAMTQLAELGDLGVRLALDDYGTGYSSLSRLHRLPFDRLKIDRSFITDLGAERTSRPIVDATVAMAHRLGLEVVAEGVETEEQLIYLRELGVDAFQGFLLGRPLPIEPFLETRP